MASMPQSSPRLPAIAVGNQITNQLNASFVPLNATTVVSEVTSLQCVAARSSSRPLNLQGSLLVATAPAVLNGSQEGSLQMVIPALMSSAFMHYEMLLIHYVSSFT